MVRGVVVCLGEVGRVVGLLDERTAVVECAGREVTAALDVVLAEGGEVGVGDVVVVSMGFVLAITDESEWAAGVAPFDREEAGR
jgi:hydrogenase maturation factor